MSKTPLLSVAGLQKIYGQSGFLGSGHEVRAVDGIDFEVGQNEILGLVGESGSGKSTTGRLVLRLEDPTAGEIHFDGNPIHGIDQRQMKMYRREMQVVFQDPYAALNPRMKVGDFVAEPLQIHGLTKNRTETRDRVADLFTQVGLPVDFMERFPHEFSGGQRQRINIARAIGVRPRLIVADEPITALDVSIQAQIVNLFSDLQAELGLAYLFIAHDLSMVRFLCHRVAVMMRGRIVEIAPTEMLFENPQHDYTRSLLSAIPIPNPAQERARQRIRFDPSDHPHRPDDVMTVVVPGHHVLRRA
ncbi:MAG: dipeptide/oligopeptide/nickel ABC transporter ATP-binding protein [Maritimibacter sp.]|nr:dipeptide/oligopeptide/nickel ABC transporter ATP-binding protein [Maritimibacter sp.]